MTLESRQSSRVFCILHSLVHRDERASDDELRSAAQAVIRAVGPQSCGTVDAPIEDLKRAYEEVLKR